MNKIALTGIKPTGSPHIGNLFGMIKPAIKLTESYQAYYFIADYHALNAVKDKELLEELTYEVASTWLACGLDPDKTLIYKQSDIPEVFELMIILAAFTSKGLMNRAHAYKQVVDDNIKNHRDKDDSVNMGLFTYPILMAADILLFDTDVVPVGKDQIQHLEMTIDIAESINKHYKKDIFKIPKPLLNDETQYIKGLDGRKMSKSYNNGIEVFLPENQLKKIIMKIVTNSQSIEEIKDPEKCNIFELYKLFALKKEQKQLAEKYRAGGMSWSYAKEELFKAINNILKPYRDKYNYYMDNKHEIDKILRKGALKAKNIAKEKINKIRSEIGIINLT